MLTRNNGKSFYLRNQPFYFRWIGAESEWIPSQNRRHPFGAASYGDENDEKVAFFNVSEETVFLTWATGVPVLRHESRCCGSRESDFHFQVQGFLADDLYCWEFRAYWCKREGFQIPWGEIAHLENHLKLGFPLAQVLMVLKLPNVGFLPLVES